jgi:hypothetical protein
MYTSSRGASILGALAFMALLGATITGFNYFPSSDSTAQTAATAAAVAPQINQTCQAGYVNLIAIGKGKFTSFVKDDNTDCYAGQTDEQKKQNKPVAPAQANTFCQNPKILKHTECRVYACTPKELLKPGAPLKCNHIGTCDTTNPTGKDCKNMMQKIGSGTTGIFTAMQQYGGNIPAFTQTLQQNLNGSSGIAAAFADPLAQVQTQTQTQIKENQDAIARIQGYVDACQGETRGTGCETSVLDAKKKEVTNLTSQNTDLKKQLDQLTEAQVALKPGLCPYGQPVNPTTGTCDGPGPTCIGNCTGGGGGGGGNPNNTFGGGSGMSGLSSLLSGLGRGLGSGLSAPAPQPAPAQICSPDQAAYSQQQQQYQQQLQQYNYQLQQYNYQLQVSSAYGQSVQPIAPQQPTPCSPSTQNQCTTQPQQPAASTCTGGTWQPTYNGSCISRWQCSGGNAGQATLSCEPKVADVGMSIAISYSCSSGTPKGNGFTIADPTKLTGTSTAVVAAPPAGTNTATYSLACTTDNQQTAGAQCSIQVGQPSIVLVGNPKTVRSGQTSLIGWITSGMQSCVVSSPDQADFTSQNAVNTSVSGTANTLPITKDSQFALRCQTIAGGTKTASTTISVQ